MATASSSETSTKICIVAGVAVAVALLIKRRQNNTPYVEKGLDPEKMGVSLTLLNAAPIMGKEKVRFSFSYCFGDISVLLLQ